MQRAARPIRVSNSLAAMTSLKIRLTFSMEDPASPSRSADSRARATARVAVRLNPYSVSVRKYQTKYWANATRPNFSTDKTRDRYGSESNGNI